MSTVLVTLVVRVANRPVALVEATLAAAAAQDHPHLEVVVAGMAAGVGPDVRARYGEWARWVDAVPGDRTGGAALEQALRGATGELVGVLEAGVGMGSSAVGAVAQVLGERPETVAACPDSFLVDGHGTLVGRVSEPSRDLLAMARDHGPVPGPGALFRRAAGERAGGWDAAMPAEVAAYDFWLRLAVIGPFVGVPEPLGLRPLPSGPQEAPGRWEVAAAHVEAARRLFRRSSLPEEVKAVEMQAAKAAYVAAALAVGGGPGGDGERFVVYDRLLELSELWRPDEGGALSVGDSLVGLRRAIAAKERQVAQLEARVAELEADRAGGLLGMAVGQARSGWRAVGDAARRLPPRSPVRRALAQARLGVRTFGLGTRARR